MKMRVICKRRRRLPPPKVSISELLMGTEKRESRCHVDPLVMSSLLLERGVGGAEGHVDEASKK